MKGESAGANAAVRAKWVAWVEGAGVVVFVLLMAGLLGGLLRGAGMTEWGWAALLLAAPLGYVLADFLSGCAHWFCDRFFEERTPVIGALLIAPFREHHADPQAITRHGFLELNGNSALALAPLAAWLWWSGDALGEGFGGMLARATVVFGALALVATNQLHRWAHEAAPPRVVRWLQGRGLILRPEQHARHHRPPHEGAYCITAGWLNAPLDRVRFFARCESAVRGLKARLPGKSRRAPLESQASLADVE
jgi:ubiquitin-conjugating enzyme E2 variant